MLHFLLLLQQLAQAALEQPQRLHLRVAVYPVGSKITVSGVTPTGYNGTYTVTVSSAGSVSFASTTTGAQTVAGTIKTLGRIVDFTTTSGSQRLVFILLITVILSVAHSPYW
jgi:hypothetical protein